MLYSSPQKRNRGILTFSTKTGPQSGQLVQGSLLGTVRTQIQDFQSNPFAISLYPSAQVLFHGKKRQFPPYSCKFVFLIFSKQQINCLLLCRVCSLTCVIKVWGLINMKEDCKAQNPCYSGTYGDRTHVIGALMVTDPS